MNKLYTLAVASLIALTTAHAAVASDVQVKNTIHKVTTYVDDNGQVRRRLERAESVVPGDELKYTVHFSNTGSRTVDAGTIVITDAIPPHTQYLDGTAFGAGTDIDYSIDGETFAKPDALTVTQDGVKSPASAQDITAIRWTFSPALNPGESGSVSFNVRLQ